MNPGKRSESKSDKRFKIAEEDSEMRPKSSEGNSMSELEHLVSSHKSDSFVNVWVAMVDKEVVSTGERLKEVLEEVRKKRPGKEPFVAKLPKNRIMLL